MDHSKEMVQVSAYLMDFHGG